MQDNSLNSQSVLVPKVFQPNPEVEVRFFHKTLKTPQVSLIVSFYNNISYLRLVLASITVQSFQNFEVIICDDGSSGNIKDELRKTLEALPFSSTHVWHSDRGFTKNECLNRGVLLSRTDYLIIIDGDCVLHPQFIEDHWIEKQEKKSLSGRRADLNPRITKSLTIEKIQSGYLQKNWPFFTLEILHRKDNNGIKGFRFKNEALYRYLNRRHRGLVGCNFSVFKKDLLAINGFDMQYTQPGVGEDSDIDQRLQMSGVYPKSMAHRGVQYHLFHPLLKRSSGINEEILKKTKELKQFYCAWGLDQLKPT